MCHELSRMRMAGAFSEGTTTDEPPSRGAVVAEAHSLGRDLDAVPQERPQRERLLERRAASDGANRGGAL